MYSRSWSSEEESLINTSVKDIVAQHPNAEGSVPFEGMKALLCGSSNAPNNVEHPEECLEADSTSNSSESDTSKSKSQNNQDLRKSVSVLPSADDLQVLDDKTPSRKESPSEKLVSKTSEKDQSENLISSNTDGISSKIDQLVLSEMAKDTLVESRGNEVEANNEPKSRVALVHKNDTKAEITKATEDSNKVAPSKFK
ncbi:hypothetical protein PCANC_27573, partial [Puccinia coronata f. sp. avenae]